jgi:hypothetical protein
MDTYKNIYTHSHSVYYYINRTKPIIFLNFCLLNFRNLEPCTNFSVSLIAFTKNWGQSQNSSLATALSTTLIGS